MLIPKGILIDCCCVLFGANLGSLLKDRVPQTIKEPMNVIFGLAAIAIGITSIIKLQTLPAVILALILGGLIGELLGLDGKVRRLFQSAIERLAGPCLGAAQPLLCLRLLLRRTVHPASYHSGHAQ